MSIHLREKHSPIQFQKHLIKIDYLQCTREAPALPVLLRDVQGHHDERFSALHHPAQPLTHSAHLWVEEVIGHATPNDRGQHLDIQPGRALGDWIFTLAAEHGC